MTVIYTADVFCDKCGDWTHGVTLDRNSGLARKAIVASKREGWSRHARSQYLDLCPKCLEEFRAAVPNAEVSGGGTPSAGLQGYTSGCGNE